MRIILLSGGSGKRLWPMSNNIRSKQFIKILPTTNGGKESMLQRVVRQLKESNIDAPITLATSSMQQDVIFGQLGENISIVSEPERRDTFPAISLACSYLAYMEGVAKDDVIVVMPCDPYTELGYFETIEKMVSIVKKNVADIVLMGVHPTSASEKFGYIIPIRHKQNNGFNFVDCFVEKPNVQKAQELLQKGALWNGGVFAFRLGYILDVIKKYIHAESFEEIRSRYNEFPKISFDYEVVEKTSSIAVVPFFGEWQDLGTWNALSTELGDSMIGNVVMNEECQNTHVVNELDLPVLCVGTKDLIVAASYDGILVSDKSKSETIKVFADKLTMHPRFEEKSWGEYRTLNEIDSIEENYSITRQIVIKKGKRLSMQHHRGCKEIWSVVGGCGELSLNEKTLTIEGCDVFIVNKNEKYSIEAFSDLTLIQTSIGKEEFIR